MSFDNRGTTGTSVEETTYVSLGLPQLYPGEGALVTRFPRIAGVASSIDRINLDTKSQNRHHAQPYPLVIPLIHGLGRLGDEP